MRQLALWVWAYLIWVLLTWTATVEQLAVGAVVAALVAVALAPLGPVVRPWLLLDPRRLGRLLALAGRAVARSAVANVKLARKVASPHPHVPSGMLVVPTAAETAAQFAAVGVVTSLIVDNQLVDVDVHARRLQYHTVEVDSADPERNRAAVNGPVEELL
jgi:multicomponent Na+:H+ antiporter subunit E